MKLHGEIRELQGLLKAKEDERKKLDAEIAALRAELEGAALLLADMPGLKKRGRKARRLRRSYRENSTVGHAVAILREAKEPLHINTLLERMAEAGHRVVKTSLAGSISRALSNDRIFTRVGKGIVGLREWDGDLTWGH